MNPDLSGELAIECHADELPRRRLPRYIEWCAPETSRFEFTDKSDVWTLGCVITILIYIKCLFKNKEILAVDQLKAKENVFHHLSSAEELVGFCAKLKCNAWHAIKLPIDLLDDLYVQVLMKHTNPEFIMRAKRCIVTAAEKPFPVNDTMEAKIKYLHDNWQHENCIEKAVVWFAENILNDKHINLTHRLSPHLFDLMYLHQANLSIITSSLRILAYSIEYEQLQSMSTCSRYPYEDVKPIALQAADKNTLSITTQLMESNQFDCEIFTNGSMVIVSLLRIKYFALQFTDEVEEDELKKEKKNGFDILYLIYNIHPDNTKVIEALLKPITSLMKYESYRQCKESTKESRKLECMKTEL
ncbi:hypothetical protein Smp_141180 [Schistosoma mansoni]|uniref:hypothetical protein n=1 Tax=Schistosoma mansoni TaxID=6183 RepID=UPI00022DC30C|nr:hypothetical protein Smp_141180 [Schistosoma mansoni]|eukprot:XP_018647897.1 hypothetical protein Smp_141180 [Schistosoma mansoni]